ncbi:unnamed protein product [Spodoptera littoralis]|uniref:Beta-1,4-N-acetylgalactosaminyltransferase n=1 Tax=Spodoptera littoralis TaxID=7109 RepID=A0A9P0I2L6_SPOLI|nr:unnamed protein product [Spodoptera littoralis]CAH1639056.1 unnamed protein product [Spodoptera littoralis]
MASFSLRLLTIFLFAALVLNISNYYFIKRYNPRPDLFRYVYTKFPKNASGIVVRRSINTRRWSPQLECDDMASTPKTQSLKVYDTEKSDASSSAAPSSVYSMMFEKTSQTASEAVLQNCPEMPPDLGPELGRSLDVKRFIEDRINDVRPGGIYQPENCKSLQSVAVIIPYRGCKGYLNVFMNVLHPFLIKQQLDYRIFVIEQSNKTQPFNRGKLINVGFVEAIRYRKDGYQCIILHDPYIIPTDTRNLYRCSWYPRQLATYVERPQKPPYMPVLGGAVAITPQQFIKLNGFSNNYWGNDADYYDLHYRINTSNYHVENSVPLFGKYKTLRKGLALWQKSSVLARTLSEYLLDGLTSLKYTVDSVELKRLFTYFQVNIDAGAHSITDKMTKEYDKRLNLSTMKVSSMK